MLVAEGSEVIKRFLFVVNADWFFISHRLPIAQNLKELGIEVHILCGDTGKFGYLRDLGFSTHALPISRGGTSLFGEFKTLREVMRIVRYLNPEIVHAITIKPVIYSGIVSRLFRVKRYVASISGLGYVFTDQSIKAHIIRSVVKLLYRVALTGKNSQVIFQNHDDERIISQMVGMPPEQVNLIRGSGVDLKRYKPSLQKKQIPVVMFLARYLIDKGIREFVSAAQKLKEKGINARFSLVGSIDEGNPNTITATELGEWIKEKGVQDLGYSDNVADTLATADIVVLPSYREGLPKSLIEAAACGKAVVTTDVPGCRDAIESNVTGLLVPPKDPISLAEAIQYLIDNPDVREQMGKEGRRLAEEAFDIDNVVQKHMDVYGLGSIQAEATK